MSDRAVSDRTVIYGHSSLFYWWPVWAVGFLMAFLTWMSPARSVTVDKDAAFVSDPVGDSWTMKHGPHSEQMLRVSASKNLGVLFAVVLLLTIVITNVQMRGPSSIIVIGAVLLACVTFAWLGWWEEILHRLDLLDVRINMGGYLLISSALFVAWLIVIAFFDRQVYAVFEPGAVEICAHIGGGTQTFRGSGIRVTKEPSDLFRHWIVGFGSGDIIIEIDSRSHIFEFSNVFVAGRKVAEANRILAMVRMDGAPTVPVQPIASRSRSEKAE